MSISNPGQELLLTRWQELLEQIEELLPLDEDEDEEPPCNKVNVIFDRIHVSDSQNDGFFGEPGPNAEWSVDLQVNGRVMNWYSDQVQDNTQFYLGHNAEVDLADPRTSEIRVDVSGVEDDSTSGDDVLPRASKTHGSKTNWGIGRSHSVHGSNGTFTYTIDYRIECLYTRTSAISKAQAVDTVKSRLQSTGMDVEQLDDDDALTIFMDRAEREGYELKSSDSETLVFEGPDSIKGVADEAFAEGDQFDNDDS